MYQRVFFLALHKTLPDWVCYQTIEENKKGNIYLKNCTGVTEGQIVRMCKSYLTFSRDRNTAPVYDEPTGHVIGFYNVSYSRTGWPLGTHWTRILDDNEIVLRKDFLNFRISRPPNNLRGLKIICMGGKLAWVENQKRCLTSSLLDGKIFEQFQRLSKLYLSPPSGKFAH